MRRAAFLLAALLPALAHAALPDITGVTFEDAVVADGAPYRTFLETQRQVVARCLGKQASLVLQAHVARDGRLLGLGYRGERTKAVDCVLRAAMDWGWPVTLGEKSGVVLTAVFDRTRKDVTLTQVEARATNATALPLGALFAEEVPSLQGGLGARGLRTDPAPVKPAGPGKVIPGKALATGGLATITVATILRKHWNALQYCWELAQEKGEKPTTGTLRLALDVEGRVTKALFEVRDAPYLAGCIETKGARVRFLTGREPTEFEQVLLFQPAE